MKYPIENERYWQYYIERAHDIISLLRGADQTKIKRVSFISVIEEDGIVKEVCFCAEGLILDYMGAHASYRHKTAGIITMRAGEMVGRRLELHNPALPIEMTSTPLCGITGFEGWRDGSNRMPWIDIGDASSATLGTAIKEAKEAYNKGILNRHEIAQLELAREEKDAERPFSCEWPIFVLNDAGISLRTIAGFIEGSWIKNLQPPA